MIKFAYMRHPLYNNVAELDAAIERYFEYVQGEYESYEMNDEDGFPIIKKVYTRAAEKPTLSMLSYHLGFESRQSLHDYAKKNPDFKRSLMRARLQIEGSYEQSLHSKYATGAIFALKNFGWTDRVQVDNTSTDGTMSPKKTVIKFNKT